MGEMLLNKSSTHQKASTTPALPSHEFWRYSLKLYNKSVVKNLCLDLQNQHGVNINIILFCCWYAATSRGPLSKVQIQRLVYSIDRWHCEITQELRNLRALISNLPEQTWTSDLRKEILMHELTSEHIEQLLLVQTISTPLLKNHSTQQKFDNCISSLHQYLVCLSISVDQTIYALLQKLLAEVFQTPPDKMDKLQLSMAL